MPRVKIDPTDIERFAKCSTTDAIAEAIWNGLDAGGDRVEIVFESRKVGEALEEIDAIEIRDFGTGICGSELSETFGKVGGSHKVDHRLTPEGRLRHGQFGRGRFTFLSLGCKAVWTTNYRSDGKLWQSTIRVEDTDVGTYEVSKPRELQSGTTGTTLRISRLKDGVRTLRFESARRELQQQLAFYLIGYPNVEVVYDGAKLDVRNQIKSSKTIRLSLGAGEDAVLVILEWVSGVRIQDSKLMLCDERKFTVGEIELTSQLKKINATAYISSRIIGDLSKSGDLGVGELHPQVNNLAKAVRKRVDKFVRDRLESESNELIARWKSEKIYPYEGEAVGFAERMERKVFDGLAIQIHRLHAPFKTGSHETRHLILQLVKHALESKPTAAQRVIGQILKLPPDKLAQLDALIVRTGLEALIEANTAVIKRLDMIEFFHLILFSKDWKARLRERTQLHRLLVHELWIFGDEYQLDSDDEPLREVLKAHLKRLGIRDELAPEPAIETIDREEKIPDLMLTKKISRGRQLIEHLVIELKNPRVKAGKEEISQIEEIARLVSTSEEFSKNPERVKWTFVLVVNELGEQGEYYINAHQMAGKPVGCIAATNSTEVRICCWSDILHDARLRYRFFQESLQVESSSEEGMKLAMEKYQHLLTGKGMTKKGERDAGKLPRRKSK